MARGKEKGLAVVFPQVPEILARPGGFEPPAKSLEEY